MTKEEAIAEINLGAKVTHRYFDKDEFVQRTPENIFMYLLSGKVKQSAFEFWEIRQDEAWQTDWELFQEPSAARR